MIGFFIAIATDSLPLYQLQLSIFGAVALVFAVDGVRPSLSPLFCSPLLRPWRRWLTPRSIPALLRR